MQLQLDTQRAETRKQRDEAAEQKKKLDQAEGVDRVLFFLIAMHLHSVVLIYFDVC